MLGSRSKRERPFINASNWVTINSFITRDTTFAIYVFVRSRPGNKLDNKPLHRTFQRAFRFFTDISIIVPLRMLQQLCRIFKRLADTAFSFFSRFFQPHFLIINVRAFVGRESFSAHTEQNYFVRLGLALFFFFFLAEANRQDLFLLNLMFSTQQNLRYFR